MSLPETAAVLRITRLADYATLLATALAGTPETVHSAAALAERTHLELTTVSKVLKALAQAGVVEGHRGVNGGYRLAREASRINLFQIVEAIEGPVGMTECSGHHSCCEHESRCGIAPHWRRVNDIVCDALKQVTLDAMLEESPRPALPPPPAPRRIPVRLATA
ncbi:MAG: SUF system Fe-S cluster assembly regulator [Lysobacteraceae bacterium]